MAMYNEALQSDTSFIAFVIAGSSDCVDQLCSVQMYAKNKAKNLNGDNIVSCQLTSF